MRDAVLDDAVRGQAAERPAFQRIAPPRGASRPEITRISVVLPAPLGR